MTKYFPCDICGLATWSRYGVCRRTPECWRENDRRIWRNAHGVPYENKSCLLCDGFITAGNRILICKRTTCYKWQAKFSKIRNAYGLSAIDYFTLWEKQDSSCYLCKEYLPFADIYVDHNHVTNKVRGLTHHQCNIIIGHAGDSPSRLHVIANSLELLEVTS